MNRNECSQRLAKDIDGKTPAARNPCNEPFQGLKSHQYYWPNSYANVLNHRTTTALYGFKSTWLRPVHPKSPRHKPHSLAVPPEGNCSSQPVAVFSHNQVRGIRIVVVINTTASATCSNAPDSRKSANTGRRSDRSSTLRVICDRPTISRRSRRPMLELRHNPAHFLLARRHLRRRPQQLEIVDKDDVTTRPRVVRIDGPRARVMQRYRKRLLSRGSSPCGR